MAMQRITESFLKCRVTSPLEKTAFFHPGLRPGFCMCFLLAVETLKFECSGQRRFGLGPFWYWGPSNRSSVWYQRVLLLCSFPGVYPCTDLESYVVYKMPIFNWSDLVGSSPNKFLFLHTKMSVRCHRIEKIIGPLLFYGF
jgi:hypothetical protein